MRIARRRVQGSVDIASQTIEAPSVNGAIEVASRATGTYLADGPGIGILTDAVAGGLVWSCRRNMPCPPDPDSPRP